MKFFQALILISLLFLSGCPADKGEAQRLEVSTPEVSKGILHEKFSFNMVEFEEGLKNLPAAAVENPNDFLSIAARMLEMQPEYLFLVDKDHALNPDFIPGEIIKLAAYPDIRTGRDGLTLDSRTAEELLKLIQAADGDGVTLRVSSAYRSYEYQQDLFKRFAERDGEEAASRYSARAGTSQHQLGTTVDLGDITNAFAVSTPGLWMNENADDFGWSLSYPQKMESVTGYKWESWHWRWIGVDAVRMQNEYFDGVQQNMLLFWHENTSTLREALLQDY